MEMLGTPTPVPEKAQVWNLAPCRAMYIVKRTNVCVGGVGGETERDRERSLDPSARKHWNL